MPSRRKPGRLFRVLTAVRCEELEILPGEVFRFRVQSCNRSTDAGAARSASESSTRWLGAKIVACTFSDFCVEGHNQWSSKISATLLLVPARCIRCRTSAARGRIKQRFGRTDRIQPTPRHVPIAASQTSIRMSESIRTSLPSISVSIDRA